MKKLIAILGVFLIVALLGWFIYSKVTIKIPFNSDNFYSMRIIGFGSIGLDTEDKSKINKVIGHLNSVRYYKNSNREMHNQSPDASIFLNDKDGKIIERIDFYGDFAEYKGNQYKVVSLMFYDRLEKLCKKLNGNSNN